VLDFLVRIVA
jgi:hypothetical protein